MDKVIEVVVRPLTGDKGGLQGALRIHLLPETMMAAGLKTGDLCELNCGDGITVTGVAWQAADRLGGGNSKPPPVKITEVAKKAFGLRDGNVASVKRSTSDPSPAEKVVLRDITSSAAAQGKQTVTENIPWLWSCGYTLSICELLMRGLVFEVSPRKGVKRQFVIEIIEGSEGDDAAYIFDDRTELVFGRPGETYSTSAETTVPDNGPLFDMTRIGGLLDQLQQLNQRLERTLRYTEPDVNEGILIHGFKGTGKSHLLQQLQDAKVRRVLQLDYSQLVGGTTSKNCDRIRETFATARSNQPSLVLIDDLDAIAPASESIYAGVLASEIDKLGHERVSVVAACRNPAEVSERLLKPRRLGESIELPVPDVAARQAILKQLSPNLDETIASLVAFRTHGYTGLDLEKLSMRARTAAYMRTQSGADPGTASAERPYHQLGDDANTATADTTAPNGTTESAHLSTSLAMDDFERALLRTRPTALSEIIFEPPSVGWENIGGSAGIRRQFDETIGWTLHHRDEMERFRVAPSKGVLLYGPPGCSKTMTAQAVASHYKLNFIAVKGAELISMYVGESERAVRELFRKAKQAAPCVIFFDEIDSIASERETGSSRGLNVLTTLLNEMDGFDTLNGVLILAATNKPGLLDPAIMRPGRFGKHIYLGPPNAAARKEIIEMRLKGVPVAEGLHVEEIVDKTEGYSGAEVSYICEEACRAALRRHLVGKPAAVDDDDLNSALERSRKTITPEMLEEYAAFAAT